MKCLNTTCKKPTGGSLVGIGREFCRHCEKEAQDRVLAYRKLAQEMRR